MAAPDNSRKTRQSWLVDWRISWPHIVLIAVLYCICLIPVWITEHFPSQNGPWFLLPTHMFKELDNPQWNFDDYYVRNWHPIPHMLHELLVLGLNYLVPLLISEKIALTIYVIALPASMFYFLSAVAPDRRIFGYFSFVMVHSFPFYRGYHDFTLSIPLFFFSLGYWYKNRESLGSRQIITLAILSVLVFLAHLFTFILLGGAAGWIRLIESRSIVKAIKAGLAVSSCAWLLFADYFLLTSRANSWVNTSERVFLPIHTAAEYLVYKYFYSMSFAAYLIGSGACAWLVYMLMRRLVLDIRSPLRWSLLQDPLMMLLAFLTVVYFLLPYKFLAWHYVNVRMIPFLLGFALVCAAPFKVTGRLLSFRNAFVAMMSVATISIVLLLSIKVQHAEQQLQEFTSGITAFEQNGRLLSVHIENDAIGQIRPLTRAHDYYHIVKGGANGASLPNYNTLTMIWYRVYPVETVFPRFDHSLGEIADLAALSSYDHFLVWGEDHKVVQLIESFAGSKLVHRHGRLRLYRNHDALPLDNSREVAIQVGK